MVIFLLLSTLIDKFDKKLLIINAKYGKNDIYKDVTQILNNCFLDNNSIEIINNTMGGDPLKNIVKEIIIEYQINKQVKTLIANEYEIIEFANNELISKSTEKSIKMLESLKKK